MSNFDKMSKMLNESEFNKDEFKKDILDALKVVENKYKASFKINRVKSKHLGDFKFSDQELFIKIKVKRDE